MEIETKIIDVDIEKFRKDITRLGAKRVFNGNLQIIILDSNSKLFKSKKMLRLRNYGDYAEITYKGPIVKGKYKTRQEINVRVDDFERAKNMFLSLGYRIIKKYKKHREIFDLTIEKKHYEIVIDDYFIIPKFAEIESKTEKDLDFILHKLNISLSQTYNGNFSGLLKRYGKTL